MSANGDEAGAKDLPGTPQVFMALPARTGDARELFLECLADLVRVVGLDVPAEPDPDDRRGWRLLVRRALRNACREGLTLPDTALGALMKAGVYDPDPSFNRQFVEPALNAFGRRRIRSVLLEYLRTGTDLERAGAARAWYWTALPLRLHDVRAENSHAETEGDSEDKAALVRAWNEAALQEFVVNEDLDVRRCILPGLPLWPSAYPSELHALVEAAVEIARSHPDEYIRHRVEHQVHG
jgi:hypothetical protein